MTIKTKSFNYGDKCESEWPPMYPERPAGGLWYWDSKKRKMIEGVPPVEPKFGQAPFVIPDNLRDPHYHQGACRVAESRSELNRMDRDTGCITTDKMIEADNKGRRRKLEEERRKDIHQATMRAINAVNQGTAPLNEAQRAACAITDDLISKSLNVDAYNMGKRRKDGRGKRWRRKRTR